MLPTHLSTQELIARLSAAKERAARDRQPDTEAVLDEAIRRLTGYRELLKKYVLHVSDHDGVSLLSSTDVPDRFTPEEWAELQRLDREMDID